MKDVELRKERDREIYSVYLRGLREQSFRNQYEAVDWVRNQPASQFYVSSKQLSNYIGAIRNGNIPPKMYEENEAKMKTLHRMYLDFLAENPNNTLGRERVCELLIYEPAPSFFISHRCCRQIIERERKRHHKLQQMKRR